MPESEDTGKTHSQPPPSEYKNTLTVNPVSLIMPHGNLEAIFESMKGQIDEDDRVEAPRKNDIYGAMRNVSTDLHQHGSRVIEALKDAEAKINITNADDRLTPPAKKADRQMVLAEVAKKVHDPELVKKLQVAINSGYANMKLPGFKHQNETVAYLMEQESRNNFKAMDTAKRILEYSNACNAEPNEQTRLLCQSVERLIPGADPLVDPKLIKEGRMSRARLENPAINYANTLHEQAAQAYYELASGAYKALEAAGYDIGMGIAELLESKRETFPERYI